MRKILTWVIAVSLSLSPTTPVLAETTSALKLLDLLSLKSESNSSSYNRTDFRHWIDEDGNGCDTRQEVLIQESRTSLDIFGKCKFVKGDWLSKFDNVKITDPAKVDIDHFVPLKEAWESGASKWTTEQRTAFANDLAFAGSLIAVSASSNRSKGDKDPAQWLPKNKNFVCEYAVTWTQVKIRWSLSIDKKEQTALKKALGACSKSKRYEVPEKYEELTAIEPSESPAPTETQSPTPSPTRSSTPTPKPTQDSSLPTVRGGAFCKASDVGTRGRGSNGTIYTCKSDGNGRNRWLQ